MSALCAFVAGAEVARFAAAAFTLAWTHSVEKIRWEEDYRVERAGLAVVEARVRGTGAGMEPPPGAVLRGGAWHYRPALERVPGVVLVDAGVVADYELCVGARCRALHAWLGAVDPGAPVRLAPCPGPGARTPGPAIPAPP